MGRHHSGLKHCCPHMLSIQCTGRVYLICMRQGWGSACSRATQSCIVLCQQWLQCRGCLAKKACTDSAKAAALSLLSRSMDFLVSRRLRQDMEAQSAALRTAVESQGREMAGLRAIAAAAEAESAAAKAELAQVRIQRQAGDTQHGLQSTMGSHNKVQACGIAACKLNTVAHKTHQSRPEGLCCIHDLVTRPYQLLQRLYCATTTCT